MCDWADIAVRELSEKKDRLTRKEAAALLRRIAAQPPADALDDEEWIAQVASMPKYMGVDVLANLRSIRLWAGKTNVVLTRRMILNMLDKAERTYAGTGRKLMGNALPEPPHWRERLVAEHPTCAFAPGGLREHDTWNSLSREDQQFYTNELNKIHA